MGQVCGVRREIGTGEMHSFEVNRRQAQDHTHAGCQPTGWHPPPRINQPAAPSTQGTLGALAALAAAACADLLPLKGAPDHQTRTANHQQLPPGAR